MTAQAIPFWQSIRQSLWGQAMVQDDSQRRMRITEDEARTLPSTVRAIRVYSGGAWVSCLDEGVLLYEGQVLNLADDPGSVVVTAIGHTPVVLELIA